MAQRPRLGKTLRCHFLMAQHESHAGESYVKKCCMTPEARAVEPLGIQSSNSETVPSFSNLNHATKELVGFRGHATFLDSFHGQCSGSSRSVPGLVLAARKTRKGRLSSSRCVAGGVREGRIQDRTEFGGAIGQRPGTGLLSRNVA